MHRVLNRHVRYDSCFVLTCSFLLPFVSIFVMDFIFHVHEQRGSHLANVQGAGAPPSAYQLCHLFCCIISLCERQKDN